MKLSPRELAYRRWYHMIDRCTNPNHENWKNYGGRGITVCDRWLTFENFYADMGDAPPGMSMDRIDNDGNYELGNVRWATRLQQTLNRRKLPCYQSFKTHCPYGHPYDEENTYLWRGRRHCRICKRLALRLSRARKKQKEAQNA